MLCFSSFARSRRHPRRRMLEPAVASDTGPGAGVLAVRPAARHVPSKVRVVVDALVDEIPRMLASDDANGERA